MLLQVNPDSAQTVVGESGPVVSDNDSEPPRYQVFHIEHSPNVHKIFIQTSFPRPAGYLYFVTDLSLQGHPQTTLPVTADVLKSSEQMGDIYQSRFVGYIASQDLDRMRAMIKEHPRPLVPDDYAPLPDYVTRCEVWNLRLQVGIGFLGITTRPTVLTNDFTPIIPTDVGVVSLSTRIAEPTWQRKLGLVLQSIGIGW